MSCGVGHTAAAPIWPLAWELPYAMDVALKRQKIKRERERNKRKEREGGREEGRKEGRKEINLWIHRLSKVDCVGHGTPVFSLQSDLNLKHRLFGVPIVAQWLTNLTRNHDVAGSIPGLAQWVGDPVLPWAEVWVADVAQIQCCCGPGIGWQLQLGLDPWPGNLHMPRVRP